MIWLLVALVAGSFVFTLLSIEAARRFHAHNGTGRNARPISFSVLKPVAGLDEGLEDNLRSFFTQRYDAPFEILFAAHFESDPAVAVVRKLQAEYPSIPSQLLFTGEPPYPNRKVRSLHVMIERAAHEVLVMSDSDIRVTPSFLSHMAQEFSEENLAVTTCPYRAVPGASFWSQLEAVMMNTEFISGILVVRMLEGMRFAVGPTIVARKQAIESIGGIESLREFLAEDFVLGQRAANKGLGVGLSRYVIEHRIGSSNFATNAEHRLRWVRSTRRSRPAGYIGQLFTYPIPLSLLLTAFAPSWWPALVAIIVARFIAAWMTARVILQAPLKPWLVPLQDLVSFTFWIAGFFGNTIRWRGVTYYLQPDGRFERVN